MSPSLQQRENREFGAELKFFVPRTAAEQIRAWARTRLAPDPNGSQPWGDAYEITSLYFDTKRFDVFHRRGSFRKSKYRVRRYGVSDVAFLERKLKTRGLVSKRRSAVNLSELENLAEFEPPAGWPGYWFHRRLSVRSLLPICQISYRRTARVLMTSYGPIRLTLDEDMRAQTVSELSFQPVEQGLLMMNDHVIVELKYRLEMPAVFKLLAEEFALCPKAISKYRLAAVTLGLVLEADTKHVANSHPGSAICLTS